MKEKRKKTTKIVLMIVAAYVIGRSKAFYETAEKYKDNIDVDTMTLGLFSKRTSKFANMNWAKPSTKTTDAK